MRTAGNISPSGLKDQVPASRVLPGGQRRGLCSEVCELQFTGKGQEFCSPALAEGSPLQGSCLENPSGGGAWWAAVCEVAQSRTQLSDFPFTFHFHALEKDTATHSSILAWRIPGTGEPGGLPSMASHRAGHY